MTALATTSDVANSLGRPLTTGPETSRATTLLITASKHVEKWTGYRFLAGSYSISRDTEGNKQILLPGTIATVAAVREIDQSDGAVTVLVLTTDYTFSGRTIYLMRRRGTIEVDFTTTASVPEEIANLVGNIVARTLAGPPVGASAESAGPFSISYVNTSGDVYLSKNDKLLLGDYRQVRPAIANLSL